MKYHALLSVHYLSPFCRGHESRDNNRIESTSNTGLLHEFSCLTIAKECFVVFFIIKGQIIINARHDLFVRKDVSVFIDVRIIVLAEVIIEIGVVIVLWNLFNCLKSMLLSRISKVLAMRTIN